MKLRSAVVAFALVAFGAGLFGAAPALAGSKTAKLGTVSATLTYKKVKGYAEYKDTHLTIANSGATVYNEPVKALLCGTLCGPLTYDKPLEVLNLDGSAAPDVLVQLYSGGAHCCQIDQVFAYDPGTQTYSMGQYDFGNFGAGLITNGGVQLFRSANNAFAYAFTDFAASGAPIQLFTVSGTKFVDVTRQYPKLIASDAKVWMKAFTSQASSKYIDTTGIVAAWAADQDMLGNSAKVSTFLNKQAAAHHLNTPLQGNPTNKRYVTSLQKFLRKQGYLG
jgi:hypothetical protein